MKARYINVNDLIVLKDVRDIFGVSLMTVHKWRNERGLKEALIIIPGSEKDVVFFELPRVLAWAKTHDKKPVNLKEWTNKRKEKLKNAVEKSA